MADDNNDNVNSEAGAINADAPIVSEGLISDTQPNFTPEQLAQDRQVADDVAADRPNSAPPVSTPGGGIASAPGSPSGAQPMKPGQPTSQGTAPGMAPGAAQVHPAVQKAGILREVAQTLAGGPRHVYSIDPKTGEMTRKDAPLSSKHIAMAIALEAIGGSLTGMAEGKGAGNQFRGGAAAFQQGEQKVLGEDQRARQDANADYARQAQIAQTNMQMLRNEQMGAEADAKLQQADVDTYADLVKQLSAPEVGGIVKNDLSEDDVQRMMHSGDANVTKDLFIPTRVVQAVGEDGKPEYRTVAGHQIPIFQKRYALIKPTAQLTLSDDTRKLLAKYQVQGYYRLDDDGKPVPLDLPTDVRLRAPMIINAIEKARVYRMQEAAENGYYANQGHPLHSDTAPNPNAPATNTTQLPQMKDTGFATISDKAAQKRNVPQALLRAVALQESSGNPHIGDNADSGAIGPYQIELSTAKDYDPNITADRLRNPETNADMAAQILAKGLKAHGGDPRQALIDYYGHGVAKSGPRTGADYADQVMARMGTTASGDQPPSQPPSFMPMSDAVAKGVLSSDDVDTYNKLRGLNLLKGNQSTLDLEKMSELHPKEYPPDSVGRVMNWIGDAIDFRYHQKQDADAARKSTEQANAGAEKLNAEHDSKVKLAKDEEQARQDVKLEVAGATGRDQNGEWNPHSIPVRLVEGGITPNQLSKRSDVYSRQLQSADEYAMDHYGLHYDVRKADSDYKYATNVSTQNTLKYLNSLTGHDNKSGNLGLITQLSDKIPRTHWTDMNDFLAWTKEHSGDKNIVAYKAAVTEVADQVGKILQGGGSGSGTSDAKLKQAVDMFKTGFDADQIRGVATTLRPMLANRKLELIGNNQFLLKDYGQAVPKGYVRVQGSDGNLYDLAPDKLDAAKKLDNGMSLIQVGS